MARWSVLGMLLWNLLAEQALPQGQTPGARPPGPTRQRKNIDALTPEELENLKHAFRTLQQRDANQANSYAGQSRVHANSCEHNNDLIWSWHRAYLYYFERLLQESDPPRTSNVTIPYWDWTRPPSGTRLPRAFEDTASSLYHANRSPGGILPSERFDVPAIMAISEWDEFGGFRNGPGQLEVQLHNYVHATTVGGSMGDTVTSANDPIFWSHHAQLDRMWDQWYRRTGLTPPGPERRLRGFPEEATVGRFLRIEDLGYEYVDTVITFDAARTIARAQSEKQRLTFPFQLPSATHAKVQLRLEDLKIPDKVTYDVYVYLHPSGLPYRPRDGQFHQAYFADSFVIWKGDHGAGTGHGVGYGLKPNKPVHPPTTTIYRDLTRCYKQCKKSSSGNQDWTITLVCMTRGERGEITEIMAGKEVTFNKASLVFK
jgi:tyrosinase